MQNEQLKVILDEIRDLKKDLQSTRDEVARVDRDLSHDRTDLEDFRVRLGTVIEEIKSMKRMLALTPQHVQEKVTDAMAPAVQATTDLKKEIKKKKSINLIAETKEKFFDKIKRWILPKEGDV